jgi:type IV pilus assembly protein PilF
MKKWLLLGGIGLLLGCAAPSNIDRQSPPLTRAQASAKIHTELAAAYYERSQLGIALEEIATALQMEANYAPAYSVRGLIYMTLREDAQAEDNFQRSLSIDNKDSESHNNYGWFLCQRGKESESIKHFMAALKNPLYGTPERAYLNSGVCSKKAGNLKDAEEFLQKALIMQPNLSGALLGLADLSVSNADYAGAKSYFMRFEKGSEADLTAENLWLAVRIERGLGDKNSEESYTLQLQKRYPDARETQLILHGK